jgi:hypothetical protein
MFAARHFDNLLVLLFFAIAIFFQILTSAAAKNRKRRGDTQRRSTSPSQRSRTDAEERDEDRIRKFLEALGQPTTSKPPPPVAPRTDIPPRPVAPVSPPREMAPNPNPTWRELKESLPRKIRLPGQIPPTREAKTFRPRVMETPGFEVHDIKAPLTTAPVVETAAEAYAIATQSSPKPAEKKTDIATLLRSTSALREAIILREIFGPPRSMQPLDLVGNV